MKNKLVTPVLIACALFLGLNTGAGLYQHLFDIPKMKSSPAAMTLASNNDVGQARYFWIPLYLGPCHADSYRHFKLEQSEQEKIRADGSRHLFIHCDRQHLVCLQTHRVCRNARHRRISQSNQTMAGVVVASPDCANDLRNHPARCDFKTENNRIIIAKSSNCTTNAAMAKHLVKALT